MTVGMTSCSVTPSVGCSRTEGIAGVVDTDMTSSASICVSPGSGCDSDK